LEIVFMVKPSLLVIFLTVFIDLIGFGIVMPLLPLYSEQFGASGFMIGLIIASFSVMQFIFSPIWGRLSDRVGRRPILLISLLGEVLSYVIFALASSRPGSTGLWLLLASRTFAGICGGNMTVAQAYVADITPPEHRSSRMALIGVAFGLGFIFGPPIGSLSAHWGLAAPGWVATGLCAVNLIAAWFILPESWKPSSSPVPNRPRMAQWLHTLSHPQIGLLIALFFLATFCFTCYETTLALLANRKFNYDQVHVGYLFAFGGVISAFVQGGLIRKLVSWLGERRLIMFSFFLMALSMGLLPIVGTLGLFLLALAILALGTSINRPPIFGLISILTPAWEQGATLGVAQSVGSLARIFGPLFSAVLFEHHPALPYLICAGIALAAGFLTMRLLHDAPVRQTTTPTTNS
jgi:multidrug resistance protein